MGPLDQVNVPSKLSSTEPSPSLAAMYLIINVVDLVGGRLVLSIIVYL